MKSATKCTKYQPIKTAAIEGLWKGTHSAPLVLFALIDQKNETNHFEVKIPYVASILNTHHINGYLQGLNSVSAKDQPQLSSLSNSNYGHWTILLVLLVCLFSSHQSLSQHAEFAKIGIFMAPLGFIALLTGWYTAEQADNLGWYTTISKPTKAYRKLAPLEY